MDQIKIGAFIQRTRKARNLTQRELAERLAISDKTVSKWETGSGLPEVGLMLPLCEQLGISVNELLSGESLDGAQYRRRAEENMVRLVREGQEAKKLRAVCLGINAVTMLAGIALILVAGLAEIPLWLRIVLIAIAALIAVGGIALACVIDREAGVFECPACGKQFVPTMKAYINGMHTLRKRRLACPHCGRTSWCRRIARRE